MYRALVFLMVLLPAAALARDDGRYADSPLKQWFESLNSRNGPCCSDADGVETEYEIRDGKYWAPIDGVLVKVPDDAVLTVPNRFGRAIKWLYFKDGKKMFRCFIPASGA